MHRRDGCGVVLVEMIGSQSTLSMSVDFYFSTKKKLPDCHLNDVLEQSNDTCPANVRLNEHAQHVTTPAGWTTGRAVVALAQQSMHDSVVLEDHFRRVLRQD